MQEQQKHQERSASVLIRTGVDPGHISKDVAETGSFLLTPCLSVGFGEMFIDAVFIVGVSGVLQAIFLPVYNVFLIP